MPPRSYIITAVVLVVLVAASLPPTMGYSILLWYWLFAAAACILAVVGVFRVINGLHAPLWIGVALALPGFAWAANRLYEMTSSVPDLGIYYTLRVAAYIALPAAAIGALRLVEMMSTPHALLRVGYGVLAVSVLLVGVESVAYATGSTFTNNALYATFARAVQVAATFVTYGAFFGAAVLITLRRNIERWTGAAISLISAYMLYKYVSSMFLISAYIRSRTISPLLLINEAAVWFEPLFMLVGAAAIWRMGSVLRARALPERFVQS
jgi:hypothetical protein